MPTSPDLAPFWLSLRVAALATLIVASAGVPLAMLLARGRFRGKGLLAGALLLPLVMPPTVLGYGLLLVLGRRAPLGRWLEAEFGVRLVFNWAGAVIASAVTALPMFLVPARASFEGVDPALEDAARLLGRGEWSVFADVTFPLARRGLLAGTVLAFARALGDFGATLMVAGDIPGRTQTAALAIYDAAQVGDSARAGLLTALVAGVSILALAVAQRSTTATGARA